MERSGKDNRPVWVPAVAVLLLGFSLTLPLLGSWDLWDPWEPKYAQTAREMNERGDWIVPYYREDPRLVKPPMTYWLIATAQSALGVTETAARLPGALLAVFSSAALALAFALRGRSLQGFLAGAALLTGPQWLLQARFATPDMVHASFLGLAFAAVVAAPALAGRLRTAVEVFAVLAVAAATLTEWPRGLLIPAWCVLAWVAVRLDWKGVAALVGVAALYFAGQQAHSGPLNVASYALALVAALVLLHTEAGIPTRKLLAGLALLIVVVAPWFVAVFSFETEEAVHRLLGYKHGINLSESVGKHTGPIYYPLKIVTIGALVWAAAALAGLFRGVGRRADPLAAVSAGAWVGVMLFFTLSASQMGHFYAVIQPPLAGLAAVGAVWLVRRRDWVLIPATLVLALIGYVVWDKPSVVLETATVKQNLYGLFDPTTLVLTVLAGWWVAVVLARLLRRDAILLAAVLPPAILVGTFAFWVVPQLTPKKSIGPLWRLYVADREEGQPIGRYGYSKDSMFYYSNNGLDRIENKGSLGQFLRTGPGEKFLIMAKKNYAGIHPELLPKGVRFEPIDETHPTHLLLRYHPAPDD